MSTAMVRFDFHGDALEAVEQDGQVFVALRSVCDALKIAAAPQRTKLAAKPWAVSTLIVSTGADGKSYERFCLALGSVPMWLAGIEASRVAKPARGKLLRFQLECHDALRDHFMAKPAEPAPPPVPGTAPVQSRLSDDPRAMAAVRAWCRTASLSSGRSVQSLQGEIRKPWGVASIYRVPLVALDHTLATLQAITVAGPPRKALPLDRRQLNMWGPS